MAPLSIEVRDFLREYYEATGPSHEECPRCRQTAFVHRAWVVDSFPPADEEIRAGLAQHARFEGCRGWLVVFRPDGAHYELWDAVTGELACRSSKFGHLVRMMTAQHDAECGARLRVAH
jgi:hypothetical protein